MGTSFCPSCHQKRVVEFGERRWGHLAARCPLDPLPGTAIAIQTFGDFLGSSVSSRTRRCSGIFLIIRDYGWSEQDRRRRRIHHPSHTQRLIPLTLRHPMIPSTPTCKIVRDALRTVHLTSIKGVVAPGRDASRLCGCRFPHRVGPVTARPERLVFTLAILPLRLKQRHGRPQHYCH